jgi:hypothetical protein
MKEKVSRCAHLDTYGSIYIDQVYMSEPLLDLLNLEILHSPAKKTLQRAGCVAKIGDLLCFCWLAKRTLLGTK